MLLAGVSAICIVLFALVRAIPVSPARVVLGPDATEADVAQFDRDHGLDLPVATDPDLQEVAFGTEEGQPMGDWYDDWIAGAFTPEGGETFQGLHDRAVAEHALG